MGRGRKKKLFAVSYPISRRTAHQSIKYIYENMQHQNWQLLFEELYQDFETPTLIWNDGTRSELISKIEMELNDFLDILSVRAACPALFQRHEANFDIHILSSNQKPKKKRCQASRRRNGRQTNSKFVTVA